MSEKTKTPREMAIEFVIKNVKYCDQGGRVANALRHLREGDTAETCDGCVDDINAVYIAHLKGIEAGAKMGWEAFDDAATREGKSFDEWWASLEGEK